jgi:hypothetical protein
MIFFATSQCKTTIRRVITLVTYDRGAGIIMMTNDFLFLEREDYSHYYHLCSDGELTPQFIHDDEDFRVAFNLVGVCAANADVRVLAFSVEDTHLHSLLYGTKACCAQFKTQYEESWVHHIGRIRGTREGADIELELIPVDSEEYLMNVGTYTIYQATKDGKQVMPFDYRWGTGSMYFRGMGHQPIWTTDIYGNYLPPVKVSEYSERARRRLLCSRLEIPGSWTMCGDILLPDNYIDVTHFERIYRTANCYRVFLGNNRNRDQMVQEKMAAFRGVSLEDAEARKHCKNIMKELYGFQDVRRLDGHQRMLLAQELRKRLKLSARQIASLALLPYKEVCKYV